MRPYWLIAALAATVSLAHAQDEQYPDPVTPEIHHHEGLDKVMDRYYSTWMVPPRRESSCCNRMDCASAETRLVNGHWEFRWINRVHPLVNWLRVPDHLIENFQVDPHESPDGQSHVCISSSGTPLCAVLGSGL